MNVLYRAVMAGLRRSSDPELGLKVWVVILLHLEGCLLVVLLGHFSGLVQAFHQLFWTEGALKLVPEVGGLKTWLSSFHSVGQEERCGLN